MYKCINYDKSFVKKMFINMYEYDGIGFEMLLLLFLFYNIECLYIVNIVEDNLIYC